MAIGAETTKLLGQVQKDPEGALRAWRGGGLSVQTLRELYSCRDADNCGEIGRFLAGYNETPSRILEELGTQSNDVGILSLLAENPRTPKAVLQQLAHHELEEVRRAVASGRSISPQTALILCDDPSPRVRSALAENAAVTPRVQALLSDDPVPFVRASLLKLGKLDEEIQLALCDDRDVTVQIKALLSPRLSEECLLRCADSDDVQIQRVLLQRKQLPEKVLESLLFSESPDVQLEAVSRKKLTPDEIVGLARSDSVTMRIHIAGMRGIPELVQQLLAEDKDKSVLLALASNPGVSSLAVSRLQEWHDDDVDFALAENSGVDVDWLNAAEQRLGQSLLRHICCREALTESERGYLATNGDESVLYHLWYRGTQFHSADVPRLGFMASHGLPSIREMAARSHGLTIAQMAELVNDLSPSVRLALAENDELPESYLEILTNDADGRVVSRASALLLKRRAETLQSELASEDGVQPEDDLDETSLDGVQAEDEGNDVMETADEEAADGPFSHRGGLLKRLLGKFGNR